MKRPALDYAALPDVPVSQMTPAEQLIAKVAWISDNAAYGTLEAAKLLIDDIRAGSFTGATPRPSARPEALRNEPMAWAVMLPAGYEFDYVVHPHKEEAEREIEEKELPADALVPLFARSPPRQRQPGKVPYCTRHGLVPHEHRCAVFSDEPHQVIDADNLPTED